MRKWPKIIWPFCVLWRLASYFRQQAFQAVSTIYLHYPLLSGSLFPDAIYSRMGVHPLIYWHVWSSTATRVVEILASEMGVRPQDNPRANETWKKHTPSCLVEQLRREKQTKIGGWKVWITYVFGRFFERNVFFLESNWKDELPIKWSIGTEKYCSFRQFRKCPFFWLWLFLQNGGA